jgi:hypothetical protein
MSGNADSKSKLDEVTVRVLSGGTMTMANWSVLENTSVFAYQSSVVSLSETYINNGATQCTHVGGGCSIHAAPESVISIFMRPSDYLNSALYPPTDPYYWEDGWEYGYIEAMAHLYYREGGFVAANTTGRPTIKVTRMFYKEGTGGTYSEVELVPESTPSLEANQVKMDSDSIFKTAHIYLFSPQGFTAADGETQIVQGKNTLTVDSMPNGMPILHYSRAAGALPANEEPPKAGFHIGWESTKLIGVFSIVSVSLDEANGTDHYKEFRLRQNKT